MQTAKEEQWLKLTFSSGSGMALYITYARVQVSALQGTTPTYDIYDSENYPLVFLHPPPLFPLVCPFTPPTPAYAI